jgi:hypothetical protein
MEIDRLMVIWTIVGVVLGVSFVIFGGTIFGRTSHEYTFWTAVSDTEPEVESSSRSLNSLSSVDTFIGPENGPTHYHFFSMTNEVNDADIEEIFLQFVSINSRLHQTMAWILSCDSWQQ